MARPPKLTHLRLEDLSDREVLLVLLDVADGGGWASAQDIADQLGIVSPEEDPGHARRVVTSRLVWLMRWGALDREPAEAVPKRKAGEEPVYRRWRCSAIGHDMATGQLRKAQEAALADARDGDMLLLAQQLVGRMQGSGTTVRNLVRREWRYRTEYAGR